MSVNKKGMVWQWLIFGLIGLVILGITILLLVKNAKDLENSANDCKGYCSDNNKCEGGGLYLIKGDCYEAGELVKGQCCFLGKDPNPDKEDDKDPDDNSDPDTPTGKEYLELRKGDAMVTISGSPQQTMADGKEYKYIFWGRREGNNDEVFKCSTMILEKDSFNIVSPNTITLSSVDKASCNENSPVTATVTAKYEEVTGTLRPPGVNDDYLLQFVVYNSKDEAVASVRLPILVEK